MTELRAPDFSFWPMLYALENLVCRVRTLLHAVVSLASHATAAAQTVRVLFMWNYREFMDM